jgi:hypothetical protein
MLLGIAAVGDAARGIADETTAAKACLYQDELKKTKIIDDRSILFTTRGGQIYSNALPRRCPGLHPGALLNYAVEGRRICAGGAFQVLLDYGTRRMPAAICPLGTFVPISEAAAADMIALSENRSSGHVKRRGSRDLVRSSPVEAPAPESK